ncbi:hypothetical protein PMAYCL1PPCAC_08405 [Pristionchus mayeri]|uniref:Uncharacterized protein n=1 Tax=Pristionchus mayeri TaxID=1317129 RepID=A0AAN5CBJ5_9BILA|nr:hypothetical protein PMAYCL1PPCAC_08405 [Pristionchus mayeri]
MSSRRNSQSQDPRPESPLSDRSPRQRDSSIPRKRSAEAPTAARLPSPKTPLPLPGSAEVPKRPRRYSTEKMTEFRMEEVHRPTDKVVQVDLEELENDVRGGTPPSSLSIPAGSGSLLNDSAVSQAVPRTSTSKKSVRKSRRAPESLLKKVLLKSANRNARPPADESEMDAYHTAGESFASNNSTLSPLRNNEAQAGYSGPNPAHRSLFSQQGAAPLTRRAASRSASRTRCQLITPLAVHTSQEVNAVSMTGQILVTSLTLVRSAHASSDVRKLINHLAEKEPLISNEMTQVDIDHDNEHSKHEVFVGSDAILIKRISTIHRGLEENTFESEDRRVYRFICQGDLLPEDRRDKQAKPRHLTIFAESSTIKNFADITKSEYVCLIFDAAEQPSSVLPDFPINDTSLPHDVNSLSKTPSVLTNSPVSFNEEVRVSDHSHIYIERRAHVNSSKHLWNEPLTELKETRVYRQQLADDAACQPVSIKRSHSMTREPVRDRSASASRRRAVSPSSRVEHGRSGRSTSRSTRNSSVLRPLRYSTLSNERRHPADLDTTMLSIQDEPARREQLPRRRSPVVFDVDNTMNDSSSLPTRTSPAPKAPHNTPIDFVLASPSPRTALQMSPRSSATGPIPASDLGTPSSKTALQMSPRTLPATIGPYNTSRAASRSPAKRLSLSPMSQQRQQEQLQWQSPRSPVQEYRREPSMRPPSLEEQQLTPLRTARQYSPARPDRSVAVVDEDTSAGSSQSPTENRTPTTVSPRRTRLTTKGYQSPAAHPSHRRISTPRRNMDEWEHMLDVTQAASPMAAGRGAGLEHFPTAADLASPPIPRSKKDLFFSDKLRAGPSARPLGPTRSCSHLQPVQQQPRPSTCRTDCFPVRRAMSEHSQLSPVSSATPLANHYRGQGYVRPAAEAPAAAPVPRPRTTRPAPPVTREPSSDPPIGLSEAVAVAASASATRVPAADAAAGPSPSPHLRKFATPHTIVGKPAPKGSTNTQKNVTLVHNPEDYNEGEILKKTLTLEAKINGHMWNLAVTFALKADRADLIRFAPKRVRIDEQTLWEETENWSQTSLTPITGPRTAARGSNSYDQLQPVALGSLPRPAGSSRSSTLTLPPPAMQSAVRVAPRGVPKTTATASTASSASSSRRSADKSKKGASKKSNSGEKKHGNGAPSI